jgi:hypothetical protein
MRRGDQCHIPETLLTCAGLLRVTRRTTYTGPLARAAAPQPTAVLLALGGLFLCGAVVAKVTARSWWYSGLRQLVLGGAAAGVTYLLGSLIGTVVG